jgi:hypothetical protein
MCQFYAKSTITSTWRLRPSFPSIGEVKLWKKVLGRLTSSRAALGWPRLGEGPLMMDPKRWRWGWQEKVDRQVIEGKVNHTGAQMLRKTQKSARETSEGRIWSPIGRPRVPPSLLCVEKRGWREEGCSRELGRWRPAPKFEAKGDECNTKTRGERTTAMRKKGDNQKQT